jgi:hypothetical protein
VLRPDRLPPSPSELRELPACEVCLSACRHRQAACWTLTPPDRGNGPRNAAPADHRSHITARRQANARRRWQLGLVQLPAPDRRCWVPSRSLSLNRPEGGAKLKSWQIFRRARISPNRMTVIAKAVLTLERQR